MFGSGDFDLLFLDIFMPGMDGFETMRLIHQLRSAGPDYRDLGTTDLFGADGAPDFLTMAIKLGAVSNLQKPFKPAALLAAVDGCLEAAERRSPPSQPASGVASCR